MCEEWVSIKAQSSYCQVLLKTIEREFKTYLTNPQAIRNNQFADEEPFLISVVFWCLGSLKLLKQSIHLWESLATQIVLNSFVADEGWYASHPALGFGDLLSTLSALQILSLFRLPCPHTQSLIPRIHKALDVVNDIRDLHCGLACLSLLKEPSLSSTRFLPFVQGCQTPNGGFSITSGRGEPHAGFTYCAIASAHLLGMESEFNWAGTLKFLKKRQQRDGGLNGRPGKPSDVCYFFWVTAGWQLLEGDQVSVDKPGLISFLEKSQRPNGMAKRLKAPDGDPYHLYFTLAACSLNQMGDYPRVSRTTCEFLDP